MAMATIDLPADTLNHSLRIALLEYFPPSLLQPDSAPLLGEVLSVLRLYNLTPSELADKWESFCLNKKHLLAEVEDGDPFNLQNIRELKKHIQETLERESRTKRHNNLSTPVTRGAKLGMADDMYSPFVAWNGLILDLRRLVPKHLMLTERFQCPLMLHLHRSRGW